MTGRTGSRNGVRIVRALLLFTLLASGGCRFEKQISGVVTDYDSGEPLQGAVVSTAQTGWGLSRGSLVWDKTHVTQTLTGTSGDFTIHYRVGDSANLAVDLDGYQHYQSWYAPDARIRVRLRQLVQDYAPLPQGFLRLGRRVDGSYYGWDFSRAGIADASRADIIPDRTEASARGSMRLHAADPGGIHYVSRATLGVDNQFLSYADVAPPDGYRNSVELDFRSGGGVLFVRRRDERYAKVEFDPDAVSMMSAPDIDRDLMLRYVYNPGGSRDLRFEEAGQVRRQQ